ncbi:hypothetical protein JCM5296_003549 [Sporobolomyces johnsonii]
MPSSSHALSRISALLADPSAPNPSSRLRALQSLTSELGFPVHLSPVEGPIEDAVDELEALLEWEQRRLRRRQARESVPLERAHTTGGGHVHSRGSPNPYIRSTSAGRGHSALTPSPSSSHFPDHLPDPLPSHPHRRESNLNLLGSLDDATLSRLADKLREIGIGRPDNWELSSWPSGPSSAGAGTPHTSDGPHKDLRRHSTTPIIHGRASALLQQDLSRRRSVPPGAPSHQVICSLPPPHSPIDPSSLNPNILAPVFASDPPHRPTLNRSEPFKPSTTEAGPSQPQPSADSSSSSSSPASYPHRPPPPPSSSSSSSTTSSPFSLSRSFSAPTALFASSCSPASSSSSAPSSALASWAADLSTSSASGGLVLPSRSARARKASRAPRDEGTPG